MLRPALAAIALAAALSTAAADPLALTIVEAAAGADPATGMPVVTVKLSAESAAAFAAFTATHVGRRVALIVDGETVSAPVVREPITAGTVQISGSMAGPDDAAALALRLSAGTAVVSVDVLPE